jgi:hypothetical protein
MRFSDHQFLHTRDAAVGEEGEVLEPQHVSDGDAIKGGDLHA